MAIFCNAMSVPDIVLQEKLRQNTLPHPDKQGKIFPLLPNFAALPGPVRAFRMRFRGC
jgi:hypothetical protein